MQWGALRHDLAVVLSYVAKGQVPLWLGSHGDVIVLARLGMLTVWQPRLVLERKAAVCSDRAVVVRTLAMR